MYSRDACHMCDDARVVVRDLCAGAGVAWEEVNVDKHPEVAAVYSELVPAVTVDGVLFGFWRIDANRILEALS